MNIVQADTIKNLLILKSEGNLSADETRRLSDEAVFEAKKLAKGFTVIDDISSFTPDSDSCVNCLKAEHEKVYALGASKVIRIVTDAMEKAFVQREERVNYQVANVYSMGEAVRLI